MPPRSSVFLIVAPALLAGCAGPRTTASLEPELVQRLTADAAAQVRRCYRAPKVIGDGKRITTRLHVRYAADGSILGMPTVLSQSGVTPSNRIFADDMAQAAIASVVRCAPLRLAPELSQFGSNSFELTFSPSLRG
jgi:uncharacterized lipoprotein YmbA